jgi:hypothetical protein
MSTERNAIELLRLRDELDALDRLVPEKWTFRVTVVVVAFFTFVLFLGGIGTLPLPMIAALFGWLVVYERRGRRARLLEKREMIQRRIRLIEGSQRD